MKKILLALLALFILLTLPVQAASGRLTAKAAASGDTVTVTVRLDNPGIIATRIFVRYDSAALQLKSAANGEVFPQGNAVFGKDITSDPYTMLWDESLRRDNNTTSGTLCTLTFAVTGGAESGKTSVRIAVDKASTFDVDLNAVTVADCSCDIDVPIVTTKAGASTTATTKAPPTTSRVTAAPGTTTTTTKAATTTTTKAATTKPASSTTTKASGTTTRLFPATTTTKTAPPTVTVPQPTLTLPQPTITAPDITGKLPTLTQTTSDASASTADGSNAGAVQTDETKDPASGETTPKILPEDGELSTASGSQVEPLIDPEPPTANHRNLLWLLLLIVPAAAAIVLILRKKQA